MRVRSTVFGLGLALATTAFTGCGSAGNTGETEEALSLGIPYLALGDSIAFGFNPTIPYTAPYTNFVGYPEDVAKDLGFKVSNAACAGETSGSFLQGAAVVDNGCHSAPGFFDGGNLKVSYGGLPSQLAYMQSYLKKTRPWLITLDIGGNDILLVENKCGDTDLGCILDTLPTTAADFEANLFTIYGDIRRQYSGPLVFVTQYATDYSNLEQLTVLGALAAGTHALQAAHPLDLNLKFADTYTAFGVAAGWGDACKAGLLLDLGNGTCDKHPSAKGAQLLASTVEAAYLL